MVTLVIWKHLQCWIYTGVCVWGVLTILDHLIVYALCFHPWTFDICGEIITNFNICWERISSFCRLWKEDMHPMSTVSRRHCHLLMSVPRGWHPLASLATWRHRSTSERRGWHPQTSVIRKHCLGDCEKILGPPDACAETISLLAPADVCAELVEPLWEYWLRTFVTKGYQSGFYNKKTAHPAVCDKTMAMCKMIDPSDEYHLSWYKSMMTPQTSVAPLDTQKEMNPLPEKYDDGISFPDDCGKMIFPADWLSDDNPGPLGEDDSISGDVWPKDVASRYLWRDNGTP